MIIEKSIDVNYSCEQMFNLIADYEAYPQFIKSCVGAITNSIAANSVIAELEMSFAGMSQKFATKTTFTPHHLITMALHSGPFKRLEGLWEFTDISELPETEKSSAQALTRCRLYMDYEMSAVLEMLIGAKFRNSMESMIESFIKRAELLYPSNTTVNS